MARNAEKAMTTLARWRQTHVGTSEKRPYLASQCSDLKDAEKWRIEIIREISNLVSQIQNAGLGEFKLRDLNDQINKLLREKRHWENRILELGGTNFFLAPKQKFDGQEAPGTRGYKYFGAAKDLPGVRELFVQEVKKQPRKTKAELLKNVDCDYFGYRDEDDGVILSLEKEAEERARSVALSLDSPP